MMWKHRKQSSQRSSGKSPCMHAMDTELKNEEILKHLSLLVHTAFQYLTPPFCHSCHWLEPGEYTKRAKSWMGRQQWRLDIQHTITTNDSLLLTPNSVAFVGWRTEMGTFSFFLSLFLRQSPLQLISFGVVKL